MDPTPPNRIRLTFHPIYVWRSAMDIDILGIDLAKRVFQLHGADRRGHALHGSKVLRAELLGAVRKLQPRIIAMEACSSAHQWGRQTEAAKSRKQQRTPKQIHEDLKELGFEGSYDRVAAFARVWRDGQTERVNPASD